MIDDLEAFISDQKAKLSKERKELEKDSLTPTLPISDRKHWSIPSSDQIYPRSSPGAVVRDDPIAVNPVGAYEQRRNEMRQETQREYQQFMDKLALSKSARLKPPTPEQGLANKLGGYAEKRQRLMAEKRNDYNRYLAEINVRRPNPNSASGILPGKNEEFGNSIPGLRDNPSTTVRKIAERNREYNEMLQNQKSPHTARKGFESPFISYAEILQKKRSEERNYRQRNNPEFFDKRTSVASPRYRNMSTSEGNLNMDDIEENSKSRDHSLEPKKVKFANSTVIPNMNAHRPQGERMRGLDPDNQHFNATLLIGERLNDDQLKKAVYREELQRQIEEKKALREREKQGYVGGASGFHLSSRDADRPTSWPPESVASRLQGDDTQAPLRPAISTAGRLPQFDDSQQFFKSGGILSNGFQFDQPRPWQNHPPPLPLGSAFQPATSLMPYNSQVNSDYVYYGMQNPLDPTLAPGSGAGIPVILAPVSGTNATSILPSDGRPTYSHHDPTAHDATEEFKTVPGSLGIAERDEQRRQANEERKRQYQQELQRQMDEARLKKMKDIEEKEQYEMKLERDIANYNPFGRDGGGAPVKDIFGNVVTSRSLGSLLSHERRPVGYTDLQKLPKSDPVMTDPTAYNHPSNSLMDAEKTGENFARGGHGIFGEPMTQEQKNSRMKYQRELRLQMEEKKFRQEKERERMKREDALLEQKIKEDAARAAQEMEETARKEKEKMEKLKQDMLGNKMKAEERKVLEEEKRRRKEEEENAKQKLQEEEILRKEQEELSQRIKSPPISSTHISRQKENRGCPNSPPIPTRRTHSQLSQISNSVALENLANLGRKLQAEQRNVENDFRRLQLDQENQSDRLILRQQNMRPNYADVFELAKTGRPASVRRLPAKDLSHPSKIKPFNGLVEKRSEEFIRPLSESQTDDDVLERSQQTILMAQQRELAELRRENDFVNRLPKRNRVLRTPPQQHSPDLLTSRSDFIEFPILDMDIDNKPMYFSNHPKQNPRERPEQDGHRAREPPRRLDSFTSADLQALTRNNEERDRRLRSLAGDDLSNNDYEDVLNRFATRNTPRRPPSGETLNDSTWMMPVNDR